MMKPITFHFRKREYVFNLRIGFFLLCFFFIFLFCILGVWQVHRYQFKKDLMDVFHQRINAPAIPILELSNDLDSLQFQHVIVQGYYDNTLIMLVQNQFHADQIGFDVLTPIKIMGDEKLLLIDRGWIPRNASGAAQPIPPVTESQNITGHIKLINEYQFILGKNILDPKARPLVMQKIDINEIKRTTGQNFYPFVLRLDPNQSNGFIRHWEVINTMPQRHMGYAIQWFGLAFVIFVAFLGFCFERKE